MLIRTLASGLILVLIISTSSANTISHRCNCDDEGNLWSIDNILDCQRVSDFLIAIAYFSIPIELLYFISCSNIPFKWVLFEFMAFIVLCGLTHFLNGWTYGHHPFQIMVALTVAKILTALVSCATAITLITLIPLLLNVKVREFLLKKKTWDLGREVGIIMKQREVGLHVRMLTQEIRKSLDRHMILYTTMFELSETLGLHYCSVWMPNEDRAEMNLTHELKDRGFSKRFDVSLSMTDPDVVSIKESDGVNLLQPDSALVAPASIGEGYVEVGPVAAIRMPMLRVSNFKGGTPEEVSTYFAILVLVLRQPRSWTNQDVEMIKVVADQVAVALSHAALLEESQLMREKLAEQNRALQQAKMNAMMASDARNGFRKIMSDGMRRPMHSIMGLLSLMQNENLNSEQRIIIETMLRTSNVVSTLVGDAMDNEMQHGGGGYPVQMICFGLHAMIKEATCLAKCLSVSKGYVFATEVERSLPYCVMGDETRVFQVILHMVGSLLKGDNNEKGCVRFRVCSENGSQGRNDRRRVTWKQSSSEGDFVYVRFEISKDNVNSLSSGTNLDGVDQERMRFPICRKLVQMMQGNIWVVPNNPQGPTQSMALVLRFQVRPKSISSPSVSDSVMHSKSNSIFQSLQVTLAEADDINRAVTKKLLEKLGCIVTTVSSGSECLKTVSQTGFAVQVVLLDLRMNDLDAFQVAMTIRKPRSNRSWPLIIVMSTANYVEEEDVWERCMQVGINGVLRKPASFREIADELRRALLQANKPGR